MSLMQTLARLEMCECGRHGRLLNSAGSITSPEFHTKDFAIAMLMTAAYKGEFTQAEVSVIQKQIETSTLPESEQDSDRRIASMVDKWNEALSLGKNLAPNKFHEYFGELRRVATDSSQDERYLAIMKKFEEIASQYRRPALDFLVGTILVQNADLSHDKIIFMFRERYRNKPPSLRGNLNDVLAILESL